MMQPDSELYELQAHEWTEEEVYWHLRKTFDDACKFFPEIMEPHLNRSADIEGRSEAKQFMRLALRETFQQRQQGIAK